MGVLDQFFVYHPEPWQDRDWARLTGLPLEEVWFQAADVATKYTREGMMASKRTIGAASQFVVCFPRG